MSINLTSQKIYMRHATCDMRSWEITWQIDASVSWTIILDDDFYTTRFLFKTQTSISIQLSNHCHIWWFDYQFHEFFRRQTQWLKHVSKFKPDELFSKIEREQASLRALVIIQWFCISKLLKYHWNKKNVCELFIVVDKSYAESFFDFFTNWNVTRFRYACQFVTIVYQKKYNENQRFVDNIILFDRRFNDQHHKLCARKSNQQTLELFVVDRDWISLEVRELYERVNNNKHSNLTTFARKLHVMLVNTVNYRFLNLEIW